MQEAQQPDIYVCPDCQRHFVLGECECVDDVYSCPKCSSKLIITDNGEMTQYFESVEQNENISIEENFNLTISLGEFEPWTDQAIKTWDKIVMTEGALDRLEWELELEYPEGMSETGFNDLLRFESDWVLQVAGIEEKPKEDEDDDIYEDIDIYESINGIEDEVEKE